MLFVRVIHITAKRKALDAARRSCRIQIAVASGMDRNALELSIYRKLPISPAAPTLRSDPAYSVAPIVRCGLPARSLGSETVWERKRSPYQLRLETGEGESLPYGQDILITILLSTAAWQQRSCSLHLGSAYQILRRLGLSVTGTDYARLARRLTRFRNCRVVSCVESRKDGASERRYPFFEASDFWFDRKNTLDQASKFDNCVSISPAFCEDIREFPIQLDMHIVRGLANAPGALDLSLFIAWRSHLVRSGRHIRIPLSGPSSLSEQLNSGPYLQERDYRRQVRAWVSKLKDVWPECPAVLTRDESNLLICHGPLITSPWASIE